MDEVSEYYHRRAISLALPTHARIPLCMANANVTVGPPVVNVDSRHSNNNYLIGIQQNHAIDIATVWPECEYVERGHLLF